MLKVCTVALESSAKCEQSERRRRDEVRRVDELSGALEQWSCVGFLELRLWP